ncbi:MAG TPA: cyclopropane-fatty-acyl-phospholipid synthase family protein [Acetobacteraceae bacterium]|nr:cyclopropane-fatty-acyl-phospholipid synthase family protein [Acetobacteraceae bacterium]
MQAALDAILKRFITRGRLTVRYPDGRQAMYSGPPGSGPEAMIALRDARAVRRLVLNPTMSVGESYMDGGLAPIGCGVYEMLDVLVTNLAASGNHPIANLRQAFGVVKRRVDQFNPASRARRNVAHHYDLNGRLYSLFLDRDRQYSCAYFPHGGETLEEAQAAKKRHIAAKLRLDRPDLSVLDIGSGWGGLALTLARDYGARVTGITLSTEQLNESRARAAAEGLQDRVSFELLDYRAMDRSFDRIVSVGMFEHVGVNHYGQFFETVRRCLKPDGVALLHYIGRFDAPGTTNAWITKYIFPGGYCPALSEVMARVEKSGLVTDDVEVLRLHYAETLRHWRRRFAANRDAIASLYDERFCRMFEFYLAGCEVAFRRHSQGVYQIQLSHDQAAVPLTRDYIGEAERQPARARASA